MLKQCLQGCSHCRTCSSDRFPYPHHLQVHLLLHRSCRRGGAPDQLVHRQRAPHSRAQTFLKTKMIIRCCQGAPQSGYVCVCVTLRVQEFVWLSLMCRGATASLPTLPNEAMEDWWKHSGTPECVHADDNTLFFLRCSLASWSLHDTPLNPFSTVVRLRHCFFQ